MAQQVLLAVTDNTSTELSRSAHHDLESFCWVLVWSTYRKILSESSPSTKDDLKPVNLEFKALFGQIEVQNIIDARTAWLGAAKGDRLKITRFLPGPMADVVRSMGAAIVAQNRTEPPTLQFLRPKLQWAQAAPELIIPEDLIDVLQGNLWLL